MILGSPNSIVVGVKDVLTVDCSLKRSWILSSGTERTGSTSQDKRDLRTGEIPAVR